MRDASQHFTGQEDYRMMRNALWTGFLAFIIGALVTGICHL